ncbi:transcriptional repressor p66-alpha-like isoform X4 [Branchiostoma lanceolatum]|uniref:transcriptional repressor p66-alpha-like isoform X4 n=1 Tax=Branchiostoma lanceolatum TaxID=7740 RepID=UPI003453E51D
MDSSPKPTESEAANAEVPDKSELQEEPEKASEQPSPSKRPFEKDDSDQEETADAQAAKKPKLDTDAETEVDAAEAETEVDAEATTSPEQCAEADAKPGAEPAAELKESTDIETDSKTVEERTTESDSKARPSENNTEDDASQDSMQSMSSKSSKQNPDSTTNDQEAEVLDFSRSGRDADDSESDSERRTTNDIKKEPVDHMDTSEAVNGDANRTEPSSRASSPDCIVLSDDSDSKSPVTNGHDEDAASKSANKAEKQNGRMSPEDHDKVIKKLKEELKSEEAKLILLKKIRQSQVQVQRENTAPGGKVAIPRQPTGSGPPPLVRGGQQPNQRGQVGMPQLMRGPMVQQARQQGPPPLIMAPRVTTPSGMNANNMVGMRGTNINIIPLQMIRPVNQNSVAVTTSNLSGSYQPIQVHQVASQHPGTPPSQQQQNDPQTAASRQAAAKLALRKQLEKTLLQIPPPKPPPPELTFLPSAANNEFICLIGLEAVVNNILDMQDPSRNAVRAQPEPLFCKQCKTDFSAMWKQEKPGSPTVICEQCVTTNQKKALKAEHTNRLKTAFVKALQQEQEIEQRMNQTLPTSSSTPSSSSPANLTSTHQHQLQQLRTHQQLLQAHSRQYHQSRSGNSHVFSQHFGQASNMQPGMFPYQVVQNKPSSAADRHREYLLDMIPSRSLPQTTISWKQ